MARFRSGNGSIGWEVVHMHTVLMLPFLSAQVSHHPPAAAHHVTSQRGWNLWQEITIDSKFRGKYISVMPLGEPQTSSF